MSKLLPRIEGGGGAGLWSEVVKFFGKEVLSPDGKINRVKLGNIVFADKKSLLS